MIRNHSARQIFLRKTFLVFLRFSLSKKIISNISKFRCLNKNFLEKGKGCTGLSILNNAEKLAEDMPFVLHKYYIWRIGREKTIITGQLEIRNFGDPECRPLGLCGYLVQCIMAFTRSLSFSRRARAALDLLTPVSFIMRSRSIGSRSSRSSSPTSSMTSSSFCWN